MYRECHTTTAKEEDAGTSPERLSSVWNSVIESRPDYGGEVPKQIPRFYLLLDRSYDTIDVRKFWAEKQVRDLSLPSFSPDLSPCDYFLFNKIRLKFRPQKVLSDTLANAISRIIDEIDNDLTKDSIHSMPRRARKCKTLNGDYTGDDIDD
ncbi:hypothetical protein X777_13188 [Ooceraea biroi]|uniref:DDE-1 domain-containing protein n=1 Tax=Ooceraea biroi TaxID=2015173 RepID=A0A026VY55_OOCBI|nr:hypothetical protein X777_13188 [Ooceraea biroi]